MNTPLILRFLRLVAIAAFTALSLSPASRAATPPALGTKVATFAKSINEMVCDPTRPRVYATTATNTVIAIDIATMSIVGEIAIGSNPTGLSVSQDGSKLYVVNSGSTTNGVGVVDLSTFTALPSLSTPFAPLSVAAGLNGHLYILGSSSLAQIDSSTGAVQFTFTGQGVTFYGGKLVISPDRKTLYYGVFSLSPSSLYSFDVSGSTITLLQSVRYAASNGRDLELSADGSMLVLVGGGGSGTGSYGIGVVPTTDIAGLVGTFSVGAYPGCGTFSPDGKTFYASRDSQGEVQVWNSTTFQKTGSFTAPDMHRLLIDPMGRYLFAADDGSQPSSPGLTVYSTGAGTYPTVNSAGPFTVHESDSVNFQLTATAGGVTWSAQGLPPGMSIDKDTGLITGSSSSPGSYSVQVTATDVEGGKGTVSITINILTLFTVQISGEGTLSGGYPSTQWVAIGTPFLITATPGANYAFGSWSGGGSTVGSKVSGKVTADMTLTATFLPTTTLTVSTGGSGSGIVTMSGTTTHVVGSNITLTATGNPGSRFIGWSGDISSNDPSLHIKLDQATSVTANFESLAPYIGSYTFAAGYSAPGSRATLSMTLNNQGTFSAKLLYGGSKYRFMGSFAGSNGFQGQVVNSSGKSVAVQLNLTLANGEPQITGSADGSSGLVSLTGCRLATFSVSHAATQAGKYTFLVAPPSGEATAYGYGKATVAANGRVKFVGKLGDGTPFTAGAIVTDSGAALISVPLYKGMGFLDGWMQFRDLPNQSDFDGTLSWSVPGKVGTKMTPNMALTSLTAAGSRFQSTTGVNILPFSSGTVTFSGGGVAVSKTNVTLSPLNRVSAVQPDPNFLRCTVNAASGVFAGSFIPPGTTAKVPFAGVVFTKNPMMIGQYKRASGHGTVQLAP